MCNENDAKRYCKLAQTIERQFPKKARANYLEAASIYLLQAKLQNNANLERLAKECYIKSLQVCNIDTRTIKNISNKQIAINIVEELDEIEKEINQKKELNKLMATI
jgi:hypothetical protein